MKKGFRLENENNIELFENLLLSYSDRIKAVIEANGSHTDY
jgi:hypothetical protein